MRYIDLFEQDSFIDNVNGWGSIPYNQNINYMGLKVKMKPSVFLSLAATLNTETSATDIANHLKNSGKIGSPFLNIKTPIEWSENDPSTPATVTGHEGRNRMLAIMRVHGDNPVETHLFFSGGISRARHLTKEIIKSVNSNLYAEKTHNLLSGPFFEI
jgi:hypothetical protein